MRYVVFAKESCPYCVKTVELLEDKEQNFKVVNFEADQTKILGEINASDKPCIMVFNKIDAYKYETIEEDDLITERTKAHYSLEEWKQTWMNNENGEAIFISALKKENLEEFKRIVYEKVKELHIKRFPYNQFLYEDYTEEE